jgi:hypothetical protein
VAELPHPSLSSSHEADIASDKDAPDSDINVVILATAIAFVAFLIVYAVSTQTAAAFTFFGVFGGVVVAVWRGARVSARASEHTIDDVLLVALLLRRRDVDASDAEALARDLERAERTLKALREAKEKRPQT